MRIVHWVRVAPHRSGLYETTRELAQAAREAGHDAVLTDVHSKGTIAGHDRGVPVVPYQDVRDADVYVLHSLIPEPFFSAGIPIVISLHGQPKYCVVSEDSEPGQAPMSTLLGYFNSPRVVGSVTFWERHVPFWQAFSRKKPVRYLPAPVDLTRFTIDGTRHLFDKDPKNAAGTYNVVFCDSWRWMKLPSQIIAAFRILWKNLGRRDIKLHMYGLPSGQREKFWRHLLTELVQDGNQFMGELDHVIPDLPGALRGCDIVITPEADESRIVREASGCGARILAPHGQPLATHHCDMENAQTIAEMLDEILVDKVEPRRGSAVEARSLECTGPKWIEAIHELTGVPCLQS